MNFFNEKSNTRVFTKILFFGSIALAESSVTTAAL